jgi:hypothetical protein
VMVIRTVIDFGELVMVVQSGGWEKGDWVGEEMWELLGFMALVSVLMCFCCCSGRCLCQGLQGAGVVYSLYSRLVSGW